MYNIFGNVQKRKKKKNERKKPPDSIETVFGSGASQKFCSFHFIIMPWHWIHLYIHILYVYVLLLITYVYVLCLSKNLNWVIFYSMVHIIDIIRLFVYSFSLIDLQFELCKCDATMYRVCSRHRWWKWWRLSLICNMMNGAWLKWKLGTVPLLIIIPNFIDELIIIFLEFGWLCFVEFIIIIHLHGTLETSIQKQNNNENIRTNGLTYERNKIKIKRKQTVAQRMRKMSRYFYIMLHAR